jgi:hypothetical protein
MAHFIQALIDFLPIVVWLLTAVGLFILAPLGIFRRTRGVAGIGLVVASWALGVVLWLYGAAVTFSYWGWIGLIVSLFVFSVGVVPAGFLALALHAKTPSRRISGTISSHAAPALVRGTGYCARQARDHTIGAPAASGLLMVAIKGQLCLLPEPGPAKFENIDQRLIGRRRSSSCACRWLRRFLKPP